MGAYEGVGCGLGQYGSAAWLLGWSAIDSHFLLVPL